MSNFAIPDYNRIIGAVRMQLPETFCILIFLVDPDSLHWHAIAEMIEDIDRETTTDLADSPFVYRCCDYSAGAFMGMIELLTKKQFQKSDIPLEVPVYITIANVTPEAWDLI